MKFKGEKDNIRVIITGPVIFREIKYKGKTIEERQNHLLANQEKSGPL